MIRNQIPEQEPLKRCPFCGGQAELEVDRSYLWFAKCHRCYAKGPLAGNGQEARKGWNRRKSYDGRDQ